MGKITKNIGYSILWLNHIGRDNSLIAKELKLSTDQVLTFLEKHNITNETVELPIKQSPVNKAIKSKELMIRHTRDKKTNSVAIMTREASAVNDSIRTKLASNKKNNNYIFNPNESK